MIGCFYKWSCLDFVLNSIEMMHKVYQESTWGASAIETDRVVWNLSLECNFVQAASDNLLTWLIIIFLKKELILQPINDAG